MPVVPPGTPPAGVAPPGQPPIGSSPATQPTPNAGYNAAGTKMLGMALIGLEHAMPLLGSGTEAGKDVMAALSRLSKHVPPGSVTPADMIQLLQKLTLAQQQFGQQMQAMRARQMQGAPPGAAPGGAPGGAAPPMAPPAPRAA